VLGDLGEWFESDFVSEGFELLDGFGFGPPGVVAVILLGWRPDPCSGVGKHHSGHITSRVPAV